MGLFEKVKKKEAERIVHEKQRVYSSVTFIL